VGGVGVGGGSGGGVGVGGGVVGWVGVWVRGGGGWGVGGWGVGGGASLVTYSVSMTQHLHRHLVSLSCRVLPWELHTPLARVQLLHHSLRAIKQAGLCVWQHLLAICLERELFRVHAQEVGRSLHVRQAVAFPKPVCVCAPCGM